MAELPPIDLGKYKDASKFRVPSLFDNNGDVLQRLIDQEVAGLDGSQHANFEAILRKYPNISKEIIASLVRNGANADTPGIDKIVSLDGVDQVIKSATAMKKLPSLASKDKNFFDRLNSAIYSGIKQTTRLGFAVLRSPYDTLTTNARNLGAVASGEKSFKEVAGDFLDPLNKTTQLGALVRDVMDGGGVSTGNGFFISPESRVGKNQAKAMGAFGRINGQSFTIGRGLLKTVGANPNSTEYKVISGIVDATLNVGLDPSTWFGAGSIKVFKEAGKLKVGFNGGRPSKIARGGDKLARAKKVAAEEQRLKQVEADLQDLDALPTEKELAKQRADALGNIKRDYKNHYLSAEDNFQKAQLPRTIREEKTKEEVVANLESLLPITDTKAPAGVAPNNALDAGDIRSAVADSMFLGNQADILDNLTQLAADEKNTLNAFDGIFVSELPTNNAITFGSSGKYEFGLKKRIGREYKTVDLLEDFTKISVDSKRATKEISNRLALADQLIKLRETAGLFEEEAAVLDRLNIQGFADDIISGTGKMNMGTFLGEAYALSKEFDPSGGALATLTRLITSIWKVDGFSNIRALHGGRGGFVLKPSVVRGLSVDASTVLGKSLNPELRASAMLDVEKIIQPSEEVIAAAKAERDAAKAARNDLNRRIREVKALREYVSSDPELAAKMLNNPEYTDLKDVMNLEMTIGKADHLREITRADAGLISHIGGTPVADISVANKYLLGRRFAVVARIVANETSPSAISRLFGDKLDMDVVRELSLAGTADDVLQVLRKNLGLGDTDPSTARSLLLKAKTAVESSNPLIKLSAPISQKMLRKIETLENAFTRVVVRSVTLPLDDLDRLSKGLRNWMSVVKVPESIINETIDELIMSTATNTRSLKTIRSKIILDAFTKVHVTLVRQYGDGDPAILKLLEESMRPSGDVKALTTQYGLNNLLPSDTPGVLINGADEIPLDGGLYVHQFLDSVVRLPDTQPIIRAINKYKMSGPLVGTRAAGKIFLEEVASVWKTTQLAFRVSYMMRNIGEMQFRQYLSGHDTLLSHPAGYIAMLMADPNGGTWQKLAASIAKYENDIFGNSFKNPQMAKEFTEAVDEHMKMMSRRVSAGDARSADVKVRMIGRMYKTIDNMNPNYHEALATTLSRFDVDDIMQLVAKADTDAAKRSIAESLFNNEPVMINNFERTDVLKEIFEAATMKVENRKVSTDFDKLFLKNPDEPFSYDNLNKEGIFNWMFDEKSSGSYATALNTIMGTGTKGIYLRKLLADGVVIIPGAKGDITIRMPRYRDMDKYETMDDADKAFKAQLAKHFPAEEMPGGKAIFADTKTLLEREESKLKQSVDWFFEQSAKLENLINFGPEYRMAYWDHIGRYAPAMSVADLEKLRENAYKTLVKIKVHTPSGKILPVGRKHSTLTIIDREIRRRRKDPIKARGVMSFEDVNATAGKQASLYVKDLFYDANNQIDAANKARLIFPFVQAWGNTIRKWGELAAQNPVKVYRFGKALDALTKPGTNVIYDITNTEYDQEQGFFYKDEFGVQRFRYPLSGLFGATVGAAMGKEASVGAMTLTAPVQSMNLAFGSVNPGFPGIGPLGQVAYAATGKSQAFGPMWDIARDLIFPFGEPGSKGSVGAVAQIALPAWLNKTFLYAINDQEMIERGIKDWAGYLASTGEYGDNPFANDAARQAVFADASGMSRWVGLATSLFQSIAPATPSQDILAKIKTPEGKYNFMYQTQLYKAWDDISNANPGNYQEAVAQFMDKFGKSNILPIVSGSTKSITGTEDAWAFLNNNPGIVSKYATRNGDIVPYFFPGGEAAVAYYNWQNATSRRSKLSSEEIQAAAEELVYSMEVSQIATQQAENNYSNVWYTNKIIALNEEYGNKPSANIIVGRQQERAKNIGLALKEEAFKTSPVYVEAKTFYDEYNKRIKHLQKVKVTSDPDLGSNAWPNRQYREELQTLGTQLMLENPAFSRMYYSVFANLLEADK